MERRPERMLAGRLLACRLLARRRLLGLLLAGVLATSGASAAEPPSYLVLRPSGPPAPRCSSWRPASSVVVSRTPYAYGYFGATSSSKWYRSSNYSRSYTQWQRR